eukprot:13862824-Alexandrium_andersonii.AAC.1
MSALDKLDDLQQSGSRGDGHARKLARKPPVAPGSTRTRASESPHDPLLSEARPRHLRMKEDVFPVGSHE